MKRKATSLSKVLPVIEKAIIRAGFRCSMIEKSKDTASFAIHSAKQKNRFFQILNLTEDRSGFMVVEIFVSNLSTTEKWVDVEVGTEILPEFIEQVMTLSAKELARGPMAEKAVKGISGQIESREPKLAMLVHELHHLEDELKDLPEGSKAKEKVLAKMAKVEDSCIRYEVEISCLALRYFTHQVEAIDPFFYEALARVSWGSKGTARA
jgi:hypothetical protein